MMYSSRLTIAIPTGFNFWRTAYSHGWCALPPFSHDASKQELERTLELRNGRLVHCRMRSGKKCLNVTVLSNESLAAEDRTDTRRQLRAMLRLDEDFAPFHAAALRHPEYRWIARAGAGRMLRAPTVFEDLVKMICTTNCTWALTVIMVTNLTKHGGKAFGSDRFAFPTPAAVADMSEHTLRTVIKSGYRAPFIRELAQRVATGELDVESWRSSPLSTEELFDEVREIKGIGPYAAGNILRLLGRCDYLALDSWVRAKYGEVHARGRKVKDKTIERHYKKYGAWRGLFFWLEMTKDWHEDKFKF